eukprot:11038868-Ditylum_brightwellii.AAC.1
MPSIIEATVNHMLQNTLLDKNVNTTVGTTVSTMTGYIVQPVKNNTKKTPSIRFNKEATTSDTEGDATSSSTGGSSAH